MSEVKTEKLSPRVTSLQLGDSGDTITIPSGVTIANSGASSGFGGVSNIHMSSKNGDFALTSATWTKVIHNVNFTGSTNYNSTTGVYTVGTGEGGYYFANFNCNIWGAGSGGTGLSMSGIYVNNAIRLKGNTSNGSGYGLGIACPSTGILDLNDADEVTIYAYGHYSSVAQHVEDEAGLHTASWTMFRIGDS